MALIAVFVMSLLMMTALNISFPTRYKSIVSAHCSAFDVDKSLVYAVIWTESKFDPDAISPKGAVGLMQLMPATASWCAKMMGEEYDYNKLFSPATNIKIGTYYLKYLINKFGEDGAIAAYNAGEGNFSAWQGEIKFKETREYIKRVNLAKKIYNIKIF